MKTPCKREKDGFCIVLKSGSWQIANITYDEQYDEKNAKIMKRHLTTDEVISLIDGAATLNIADDSGCIEKTSLKKGLVYCIKKGEWHSLTVSRDALLIVAEGSDVSSENTERMIIE